MAATCFCGHGQPVKGVRRRASNGLGAQIQADLKTFQGIVDDGLVDDDAAAISELVAMGRPLLDEISAVVHGSEKSSDYKDRVKAWTNQVGKLRFRAERALHEHGFSGKWFGRASTKVYGGTRVDGVVASVRDTGTTMNDDPRVELTVRIPGPDGEPLDLTRKMLVPRISIPRPNDPVEVAYEPDDPSDFVFRLRTADGVATDEPGRDETPDTERIEQLERLARLHETGALSDDEFASEKLRILGAD